MVLYEYFFSSPVAKILSAWWVTEENLGCLKRPFPGSFPFWCAHSCTTRHQSRGVTQTLPRWEFESGGLHARWGRLVGPQLSSPRGKKESGPFRFDSLPYDSECRRAQRALVNSHWIVEVDLRGLGSSHDVSTVVQV